MLLQTIHKMPGSEVEIYKSWNLQLKPREDCKKNLDSSQQKYSLSRGF